MRFDCRSQSIDAILNDMKVFLLNDVIHTKEHTNYTLFYKQRFLSTLPQCCLTFS